MNTPADIITRIQTAAQEGTRSDQRLAALVLSDPDFVSRAAISEIAARVEVSEPTVTRFCRTLGCEGLRDFKFYLAQAMAIGAPYLAAEPISRDAHEQRIATSISESAVEAIQRVAENIDMGLVLSVARRVAEAHKILVIGSGGISSMMATEMQNRLFRLGIPVTAQTDGELQRMYASTADRNTVLIGFSVSGHARSILDANQVAQQYGAHTVAVTVPDSAFARAANAVIAYQPMEDSNLYKPTSSRFALLAVVDMLAMAIAEARGPQVLEGLRRLKQSINMFKVDRPGLPLGD